MFLRHGGEYFGGAGMEQKKRQIEQELTEPADSWFRNNFTDFGDRSIQSKY